MEKSVLLVVLVVIFHHAAAETENGTYVQIGSVVYKSEKIERITENAIERVGVNKKGDIYYWYGFMPYVLYEGADAPVPVPGLTPRVICGFAIDSHDDFYFCRHFYGLFVVRNGTVGERQIAGVHMEISAVSVDIHDNIYLGSQYRVAKVEFAEPESNAIDLDGFPYGFRVAAAVDSKGNIYFREGFRYFIYQNIQEGAKSRRQIPEIGLESALSASCDTKDNVFVATTVGLFYIKAHTQGRSIENVKYFQGKKVTTVHVDWNRNDTVYVSVENEGLYKLTYDRDGAASVKINIAFLFSSLAFALLYENKRQ